MGYVYARTFAASHPDRHIIIASRNQRQGTRAVSTLQHKTGNQHIAWMSLDLASLASVPTYTQDGFEMTFGVNCLGHFLLVNLLLPQLVAPARIVFVS